MSDEPRRIARRALFGRLLPRAPEAGHGVEVHRTALACRFEVTLDPADARHLEAARAALDEVDAIEDTLSWFRDTSEVSRLNRQAAKAPVPVSPGLFTLLSLCRELNAATGGAFYPASTALSRCWGFLERRPHLPPDEEIATARARSGLDKVTLDGMGRAVRFAVNAPRQSADDGDSAPCQFQRQHVGYFTPICAGLPGTNDGHGHRQKGG